MTSFDLHRYGVSVPLRGLGMKAGSYAVFIYAQAELFPSPCGVLGMKERYTVHILQTGLDEFPSPCGVLGMKGLLFAVFADCSRLPSFRPLAGF